MTEYLFLYFSVLLISFVSATHATCSNKIGDYKCDAWKSRGYCEKTYVQYMKEYCTKSCGLCDICELPPDNGPCKGSLKRYYFDRNSGECKEFFYGGCRGNGNRFETNTECMIKCGVTCNNEDADYKCDAWRDLGFCDKTYVTYMKVNCMKSCKKCVDPTCQTACKPKEKCTAKDTCTCGGKTTCTAPKTCDGTTCECSKFCTSEYRPVCGTDGKTYGNSCELSRAVCITGNDKLDVAYDGRCQDCPRFCTGLYRPVCGSDGKTYGNHCTFKQAACNTGNDQLTVDHFGLFLAHEGVCQVQTCEGKTCGESCRLGGHPGVCDGKGTCRNILENPCSANGCEGKQCGNFCLVGDIAGYCDSDRKCFHGGKPDCGAGFCTCGKKCKMTNGVIGVCQTDGKTCAINVQQPNCKPDCLDTVTNCAKQVNVNRTYCQIIPLIRKNCRKTCGLCGQ